MKYIRTKDGRIGTGWEIASKPNMISFGQPHRFRQEISKDNIIAQADTIEELSDGLLVEDKYNSSNWFIMEIDEFKNEQTHLKEWHYYAFIKTNKGLIYVAKMNDKGELELL